MIWQISNLTLATSGSVSEQTEATLGHHLGAFGAGDVDEIMRDYTEDSAIITPDGPLRGLFSN